MPLVGMVAVFGETPMLESVCCTVTLTLLVTLSPPALVIVTVKS